MQRRLIKQGGGGYTIYLPKKWVTQKGLKEGSEVDVVETETDIVIRSGTKGESEITVEVTKENRKDIKAILTHIYRRGFDTIIAKEADKASMDEIISTTKDLLLGFEVTESGGTQCKIENVSEPTVGKYSVLLRRCFLLVKETQRIIMADFKKGSFHNMEEIQRLRKLQDSYVLFCRRILIKEKHQRNPIMHWELLTFLMHIEHAHYFMYQYAWANKVRKQDGIIEVLGQLQEYFELYYRAFFEREIRFVHRINELKEEYQFETCFHLIEESKGKKTVVLSQIREIFRLIQIGTSPILTLLFERSCLP